MAQVINIEEFRKVTDTSGFAGKLQLRGNYIRGQHELASLITGIDVQYKSRNGKHLYLVLTDYSVTTSDTLKFQDAAFLHFRYNRKLNKTIRFEAFTQLQDDKVLQLHMRYLLGAGIRLKLLELKPLKFYTAALPMLEVERVKYGEPVTYIRLSTYLSTTVKLSDWASLAATCYYQPLLSRPADYRFLAVGRLTSAISKKTSLLCTGSFLWDEVPPLKAPGKFINFSTGLSYTFK